jgi:MraZ protein
VEANGTVGPTVYNSRFRHGVDDKRRIAIPSKWRPSEAGTELTVVLWPKAREGACLRVLPPSKLTELMQSIAAMPNSDPNKCVLKRVIGGESVQVTLDKVGRITVPEEMTKAAGIDKEVILVGLLDQFEIWSPERFEKVRISDEILSQEAFRLLE